MEKGCAWCSDHRLVPSWIGCSYGVGPEGPSVVASDLGKYCLMASTVTPGHVLKWPFLMACIQVLVVGKKRIGADILYAPVSS